MPKLNTYTRTVVPNGDSLIPLAHNPDSAFRVVTRTVANFIADFSLVVANVVAVLRASVLRLNHQGSVPTTAASETALYATAAGVFLREASNGQSLKLFDLETNAQTVADYTLVLSDRGKIVSMSNNAANFLRVPPSSTTLFPPGAQIITRWEGVGQPSFIAGSGVTIKSADNKYKLRVRYSGATLIRDELLPDTWWLTGDTAA